MRKIDEIIKDLSSDYENHIIERAKKIDEEIECILRNKIKRPIKGKITKRKLRARGITRLAYYKCKFIGVIQRGKVIGVNGEVEFPLTDDPLGIVNDFVFGRRVEIFD